MRFAEILRQIQADHGFETQKQLAEFLGLDRTSVSRYLKGTEEPGYEVLVRVSEATGRPVLGEPLSMIGESPQVYATKPCATKADFKRCIKSLFPALTEGEAIEVLRYAEYRAAAVAKSSGRVAAKR